MQADRGPSGSKLLTKQAPTDTKKPTVSSGGSLGAECSGMGGKLHWNEKLSMKRGEALVPSRNQIELNCGELGAMDKVEVDLSNLGDVLGGLKPGVIGLVEVSNPGCVTNG